MIKELLDIFYPRICVVCGRRLQADEKHLCIHCMQHIPRTHFHIEESHPMEQLFRGKVEIDNAFAFFYTSPQSEYRHILHHIKYHDGKECAHYLGRQYAIELSDTDSLHDIDLIMPVPLHHSRLRQRGYNQSEWIARGISDVTDIPIDTHSLIRMKSNPSQTRLSIYERWLNTQNIFKLSHNIDSSTSHILIVDDIVTTGATLLACIEALQETFSGKISVLALSIAR